jgi:valyl-tRNA synthetase
MEMVSIKPTSSFSFIVKSSEFYVPLNDNIDKSAEIKRIKKELKYNEGFLETVKSKLDNENFVINAPQQVIRNEKNKLADSKKKIKILQKRIKDLI